ncbi:hypothetical protein [Algibacter mikhailovii]|uniref:Uncharacterized protein n=1 Tax=Algibacter mikhailovii TaxID=425498 RepID=A0A918R3Q1_9FLAO|nr:hypothetical protein [Algibacter mikhailovii]GGZ84651.1 hypothetical protein GCM10007028_23310 [Algibacter mikhailovii]
MKGKHVILIVCLLSLKLTFSQNTYDIVFPKKGENEKCRTCFEIFNQKPEDVEFSITRKGDIVYFQVNDINWFNRLFENSGDGLAVDIVPKNKYSCLKNSLPVNEIRGTLLKPIYSKLLKKNLELKGETNYQVELGKIPKELLNEDLEFNILFLSNRNLCRYYIIYDLKSYDWDLLDMGMYLDELTFTPKQIKSSDDQSFLVKNKSLKFIIPFNKNQTTFSKTDIKPIYDSLKLTDFNIKTINIKAYASIEGIVKRNMVLQEQRANSIVQALQSFQNPTIETYVTSSENWVEFFNDIEGTKYEYLKPLTKNEVRDKIAGSVSKQMEPILKNHRKAVVELELVRKDKYKSFSSDDLITKFNTLIKKKNIEEAKDVQNSIFERLKGKPEELKLLNKMSIPKEQAFIDILNKNEAFKFMTDFTYALIVYTELKELEKLAPNNAAIKYNLSTLKLKLWHWNALNINREDLNTQIFSLEKYGVAQTEISRMLVNSHIILSELFSGEGDFASKDNSVAFVNSNYKKFKLSNNDYLNLAQYLNKYGNPTMAVDLLDGKARTIDIDEDLLFYYLNLSLIDEKLIEDKGYRTIMLNAINMNKARFCKLFNSVDSGGVTFQLLENQFLRKTYCENCNN